MDPHFKDRSKVRDVLDGDPSTPAAALFGVAGTAEVYPWTGYEPGTDVKPGKWRNVANLAHRKV